MKFSKQVAAMVAAVGVFAGGAANAALDTAITTGITTATGDLTDLYKALIAGGVALFVVKVVARKFRIG